MPPGLPKALHTRSWGLSLDEEFFRLGLGPASSDDHWGFSSDDGMVIFLRALSCGKRGFPGVIP